MRSTIRPSGKLHKRDLKPRNLYRVVCGVKEDVGDVVLCTDNYTLISLYTYDGKSLFITWGGDEDDYRFEPFSGELILTS